MKDINRIKKTKQFLCIIPARSGSKEIPNKNIKKINSYPLIYYVVNAVKKSKIFDRIIVSTDSDRIAKIAKIYGADVPFLRPKYLSTDTSLIKETIVHLLKKVEKKDKKYDYVCLVQTTSPLLKKMDIINAVFFLINKKADMIVSVSKVPFNSNLIGVLPKDLSMKNFLSANKYQTKRQMFKTKYILNGAIYLGKWDIFYYKKDYYLQDTYAYIMPEERSIDIDSYFNLKIAKLLLKEGRQKRK